MTVPTTAVPLNRRPVSPADDALLMSLFADARPELFLLDPLVRDRVVDLQLRAQRREYAVAHPQATHDILVVDGVDVGQLVLAQTPNEVRIVDLSVLSSHRGRGIGSSVLREVIDEADRRGRRVQLSVWSDNTAARHLYASLGFVAEAKCDTAVGYVEMTRSTHV